MKPPVRLWFLPVSYQINRMQHSTEMGFGLAGGTSYPKRVGRRSTKPPGKRCGRDNTRDLRLGV